MRVQLVRKYPYVSPSIEFDNVKGLTANEQKELLKLLKKKCDKLANQGLVMVCEIGASTSVDDMMFILDLLGKMIHHVCLSYDSSMCGGLSFYPQ